MKTPFFLTCLFAVILTSCSSSAQSVKAIPTVMSPDHKIVYAADNGFSRDIFVMKSDGSGRINLTEADGYHGFENPVWSPDGNKIAFTGTVGFDLNTRENDIFVMNSDGSNVIQLTAHSGWNTHPVWSPDNRQIAFVSNRYNKIDQIFVVNFDGTNLRQLTKSEDAWSLKRHKNRVST
jgi:TolB protein